MSFSKMAGIDCDKHFILDLEDLNRTGGSWVLMSKWTRCSVIRTMEGERTVGMRSNGDCWFEWVKINENSKTK